VVEGLLTQQQLVLMWRWLLTQLVPLEVSFLAVLLLVAAKGLL
jgi:hypothetical protein